MKVTLRGASMAQLAVGAFWLGAAVLVAAVVAPAAFAALPSRALAGDVVGRILPVVFWSGMVVFAAVMLLGVWTDRQSRFKPRVLFAAIAGAACMIAQLIVDPIIGRVRAQANGPIEALPAANPLRVAFGQLHLLSVVLLGIAMLGAAAILLLVLRDKRAAA